jgi:hypothetical protein
MNRIFDGVEIREGIAEVRGQIAEVNRDKVSGFQCFNPNLRWWSLKPWNLETSALYLCNLTSHHDLFAVL